MGDFNINIDDKFMIDLCRMNDLSSLTDKLKRVTKTLINLHIGLTLTKKPFTSSLVIILRLPFPTFN